MKKFSDRKWFSFYKYAPIAIAGFLEVAFFIAGIVMAIDFSEGYYLAIFWFGGTLLCVITYVLLKIKFSYMLVHIEMLDLINDNLDKIVLNQKPSNTGNHINRGAVNNVSEPRYDFPEI